MESSHPNCPQCHANRAVYQLVEITEVEGRILDENGDVEDYSEGKRRKEIGWGWDCQDCHHEFDLTGSLGEELRPQLTATDWAEIIYAIDSKLHRLQSGDDGHQVIQDQITHLERIMQTIGPDGGRMTASFNKVAASRSL